MLQSQAITESYFSSNDEIIELKANMINPLAHFCVDGGTVIEIFIQATVETVANGAVLSVMNKDLEILAQAASSDASAPSSMSALYHGAIHDETELLIALTTRMDDTIIEDRFQYSYKLYNSNFPLISAPNKSCYTE